MQVRVPFCERLARDSSTPLVCVCVCVRARARVRACVCVWVGG